MSVCAYTDKKYTYMYMNTQNTYIHIYICTQVMLMAQSKQAYLYIYTSACICISRCTRLLLLPPAMAVLLCDSGGLGWSLRSWPPHRFVGVCLRLSRQFALRSGTSSSSCRKTLSSNGGRWTQPRCANCISELNVGL